MKERDAVEGGGAAMTREKGEVEGRGPRVKGGRETKRKGEKKRKGRERKRKKREKERRRRKKERGCWMGRGREEGTKDKGGGGGNEGREQGNKGEREKGLRAVIIRQTKQGR
ncbi:hypothetical protein K457DRAFT_341017 [Linnemannia elongata AG-77]|uniref:Uncharacterized protein n=1 Tax=Linnemannia elongata AG-77 TaxID=1314771 RepID=A0A197K6A8_9FUNG|nr:hypothetical protein K457DRAFT_341017 [Linnemannia elongata AG-77]